MYQILSSLRSVSFEDEDFEELSSCNVWETPVLEIKQPYVGLLPESTGRETGLGIQCPDQSKLGERFLGAWRATAPDYHDISFAQLFFPRENTLKRRKETWKYGWKEFFLMGFFLTYGPLWGLRNGTGIIKMSFFLKLRRQADISL